MGTLRVGLKDIEKELEYFENQSIIPGDRFVSVMTQFATVASYNFSEVEETYGDMKKKVSYIFLEWSLSTNRQRITE